MQCRRSAPTWTRDGSSSGASPPGDTVHRGDLIAVVETEKSDIDIEIWHDGIIDDFLVDVGQLVDVGTPIARLRSIDGTAPPPRSPPPDEPASVARTGEAGARIAARSGARSSAGDRPRRCPWQRAGRRSGRGRRHRGLDRRAATSGAGEERIAAALAGQDASVDRRTHGNGQS